MALAFTRSCMSFTSASFRKLCSNILSVSARSRIWEGVTDSFANTRRNFEISEEAQKNGYESSEVATRCRISTITSTDSWDGYRSNSFTNIATPPASTNRRAPFGSTLVTPAFFRSTPTVLLTTRSRARKSYATRSLDNNSTKWGNTGRIVTKTPASRMAGRTERCDVKGINTSVHIRMIS